MKNLRLLVIVFITLITISNIALAAKKSRSTISVERSIRASIKELADSTSLPIKCSGIICNNNKRTITIKTNKYLSYLPIREGFIDSISTVIKDSLDSKYSEYNINILSSGENIKDLIPNYYREKTSPDNSRMAKGKDGNRQIVKNRSKVTESKSGLAGKNIALWNSHGWYYENTLDRWEWQRARCFTTVEDMWTFEFTALISDMLENAGASTLIPRERDVQTERVIVDNDNSKGSLICEEQGDGWQTARDPGFSHKYPFYVEGENRFKMGTARYITSSNKATASVIYNPKLNIQGEYAVYVTYQSSKNSAPDAHYAVTHSGGTTHFSVNQTMGGGTWIYLGTFHFNQGDSGYVTLDNSSASEGKIISADAVKFGGGYGVIARGSNRDLKRLVSLRDQKGFDLDPELYRDFTGRKPAYQLASRYYQQASGMPDTLVYSLNREPSKDSYSNRGAAAAEWAAREAAKADYKDDYQSRGEWVNYLMGAPNGPTDHEDAEGLNIPIDLTMGFHTDAGITPNDSIIGSLMIYNTSYHFDQFPNGQSRWTSRDFADITQTQVVNDLREKFEPKWTRRGLWNSAYSEAWRPKTPTILSEFMSHQNFADIYLAMDPEVKFTVARAYYKGMLKYLSSSENRPYVVQPLSIDNFRIDKVDSRKIKLSWKGVEDPLEPTATPTGYIVYTKIGENGFDNGKYTTSNNITLTVEKNRIYSYRVAAVNDGGESFKSEQLSYSISGDGSKQILIVNGFDRVAPPAAFDNGDEAGFLMNIDEGVAYNINRAYIGEQYDFRRDSEWIDDDAPGFGASYADMEDKIVLGNSFDFVYVHGEALAQKGYSFTSMSDEAFEAMSWNGNDYLAVDILMGEEKTTVSLNGKARERFSIYTPEMISAISKYLETDNPKLIISGAYIGSDIIRERQDSIGHISRYEESNARNFIENRLHFKLRTDHASKRSSINNSFELNEDFKVDIEFETEYNENRYRVESPDAIEPATKSAKTFLRYRDNSKSAGVVYRGNYGVAAIGFPLESIRDREDLSDLFDQILKYLKTNK